MLIYRKLREHMEKIGVMIVLCMLMFGLFLLSTSEPGKPYRGGYPPLLWGYGSSSTPSSETSCSDGVDDDGDGVTDCEDADDCSLSADCAEDCSNGTDDDGDFAVDCDDLWCENDPSCA